MKCECTAEMCDFVSGCNATSTTGYYSEMLFTNTVNLLICSDKLYSSKIDWIISLYVGASDNQNQDNAFKSVWQYCNNLTNRLFCHDLLNNVCRETRKAQAETIVVRSFRCLNYKNSLFVIFNTCLFSKYLRFTELFLFDPCPLFLGNKIVTKI